MGSQVTTVALDLEGTLVSNAVSVFPRDGLFEFLEGCQRLFPRVVVFTAVGEERFRWVADVLVTERVAPPWFRDVEYFRATETKDLGRVCADPTRAVLVDDLQQYVHGDQQWVRARQWEPPYEEDGELARLLVELEGWAPGRLASES